MRDTNEAFVMVPRDKLQYVRDLLTEKVYGSPARSPGHNARLEVDAMLSASPSPVADMVSRDQEVERLREALKAARQFIVNGVEFGYIHVPKGDTAEYTLGKIRAALGDST